MTAMNQARIVAKVHADRLAMDAQLGLRRHDVMDVPGKHITTAGELVRVTGIGIGEPVRFVEYVENLNDPARSYVTVRDTYRKNRSHATFAVRAEQVSRVKGQRP
jgi:hypothetical protein